MKWLNALVAVALFCCIDAGLVLTPDRIGGAVSVVIALICLNLMVKERT